MTRIIVTGGRYFRDVPTLWRVLDELDAQHHIDTVIEGASDKVTGHYAGADYWANQWCITRGREAIRCPADWKTYGRRAGPIRNGYMLRLEPDYLVAFPGGSGTRDMTEQAKKAGVPIWEWEVPF